MRGRCRRASLLPGGRFTPRLEARAIEPRGARRAAAARAGPGLRAGQYLAMRTVPTSWSWRSRAVDVDQGSPAADVRLMTDRVASPRADRPPARRRSGADDRSLNGVFVNPNGRMAGPQRRRRSSSGATGALPRAERTQLSAASESVVRLATPATLASLFAGTHCPGRRHGRLGSAEPERQSCVAGRCTLTLDYLLGEFDETATTDQSVTVDVDWDHSGSPSAHFVADAARALRLRQL